LKLWFSGKEWLVIMVIGPLIIFLLAMVDIPFKYWFPLIGIFGEWILDYSFFDLVSMSGMTLLSGAMLGAMIVVGYKIWKL